ncbi:ImmA/IrrE family metallo-endopeptidase [Clostridium paraputrificum]|uniref:ImmA/IrrE family metallo-endopeptidase n=2 Tax=Clostridium paraputrificum TaxID=29363 RepID=UPI000D97A8DF|nr:ImmA/IrrE family metallo-endopeptidase [Clostridium paraputrificum]MDB2104037.1 ImmA/IrrE family metallo-endopeptidase [Clostridium paraputrificum]SQB99813.1 putative Zn peptidase [Clostridium paraputrificum]
MIPKYARYKYCINKSIEFILNENINRFPFDSDTIIKNRKWARIKYENLAEEHNVNLADIIEAYQSEDGYSIYNGRNYTIAYNNTHIPKRIYFTKLHEIGHIYLNHFIDFEETILNRSNMTKSKYKVLENEANCFARNVIAPAVIVKHLKLDTPIKVSKYFGITKQCSETRLDLLQYDLKHISKEIESQQLEFFKKYLYKKQCLNCKNGTTDENIFYCPICGHNKLIWGDGEMNYDYILLNDRSKAKICPTCENENTNIDGNFCQICGTQILNECTSHKCKSTLSGDARYCSFCGCESTFSRDGLLKDWQIVKSEQEFLDLDTKPIDSFSSAQNDFEPIVDFPF